MCVRKKVNRMVFLLTVIVGAFATFLSFSLQDAGWAAEKTFELSFSHVMPPTHFILKPGTGAFIRFFNDMEQKTGGRVKVTKLYDSCVLGKPGDFLDHLKAGMVDIANLIPGLHPGLFPLTSIGQLAFPGRGESLKSIEIALNELHKKGLLDKNWNEVKPLLLGATDANHLLLRKKVERFEDLKGLKVATDGGSQDELVKAWGATPMPMPSSEMYMALQRGVLDGALRNWGAILALRLYEVVKYVVEIPATCSPVSASMSLKTWEQFPSDIKKIIEELSQEYVGTVIWGSEERNIMGFGLFGEREVVPIVVSKGVEIVKLPAAEMEKMQNAIAYTWNNWAKEMEAQGLPGRKVMQEYASILSRLGVEPMYKP